MTATEQLKRQLDALPPDEREAEAARILDDLQKRMQQRRAETADSEERPEKQVTFDDIKHLLGKGKGPGDLSTNPKYLDDLGQSSMR